MKKILSVLLALALIVSLGITAFAAAGDPSAATTITIYKDFTVTGGSTFPTQELTFTSTPDSGNPDTTNLTVAALTPAAAADNAITVSVPSYSKVGVYNYTITENTPTTAAQGVTYSTESIGIAVLVTYADDGSLQAEVGIAKDAEGNKLDTFTNTYALGELEVTKTVSGNLGDKNKLFDFTITLTAANTVYSDITVAGGSDAANAQTIAGGWTGEKAISIKLKHGETVNVTNIPEGVTYTVEEAAKHAEGGVNSEEGYTVTKTGDTGTISSTKSTAAFTNTKETTIDTGVALDYLPYVLIVLVVLAAAIFMIIRKRRYTED